MEGEKPEIIDASDAAGSDRPEEAGPGPADGDRSGPGGPAAAERSGRPLQVPADAGEWRRLREAWASFDAPLASWTRALAPRAGGKLRPERWLSGGGRRLVEAWAKGPDPIPGLMSRAVLMIADGMGDGEAAKELGVVRRAVSRWREIFARSGPEGLAALVRRPKPRSARTPDRDVLFRRILDHWAVFGDEPLAKRARVALLAGEGRSRSEIAGAVGVRPDTVDGWLWLNTMGGPLMLKEDLDVPAGGVGLDAGRRRILETWAADASSPLRAERALAVLTAGDGVSREETAKRLGVSRAAVGSWLGAFNVGGVEALVPRRSGAPPL